MNRVAAEYQGFLEKANAFAEKIKLSGIAPTPELARAGLDAIGQMSLPKVDVSKVTNSTVNLPDRQIPVRIYDPQPGKRKPVLVFMHGGGHMAGSINLYDGITRRLADSTDHLVVSIGYRLSPEFLYPAGLDDCQAVIDQLDILLKDYQIDLDNISLVGDSAGGALASTISYQDKTNKFSGLILIYPSLDYTFSTPSYKTMATGYLLETEKIVWYFDQCFSPEDDRKAASPLFFSELDHMPKTLTLAAAFDPLADEGKLFHEKLIAAGVESKYHEGADLIHCFLNLEALNPDLIDQTYKTIAGFLKKS